MKNKNQVIADQVIALMKTAGNDWSSGLVNGNTTPISLSTGKQYSGGNWLTLSLEQQIKKYECNVWGTFNGYKKLGLYVPAKKSVTIPFYKPYIHTDLEGVETTRVTTKYYHLWNGDQVEGFQYEKKESVTNTDDDSAKIADSFGVDCGANIKNIDNKTAYYSIKNDFINLPKIELFESGVSYAGYLLHELAHWSGHKTRLDRFTADSGTSYPFEELVAELGATMLLSQLNIEKTPRLDHAQYLNSWVRMLENKPDSILRAANKAAQATDYLLNLQLENQEKLAA